MIGTFFLYFYMTTYALMPSSSSPTPCPLTVTTVLSVSMSSFSLFSFLLDPFTTPSYLFFKEKSQKAIYIQRRN